MPLVTVKNVSEERHNQIEPLLTSILQHASLPSLVLGRTCAHVLLESVRILPFKKDEQNVLTTTTVFLTALLTARRLAAENQLKSDADIGGELSRLREWGIILRGDYGDQFDRLLIDYFQETPIPDKDEFEELPADPDLQNIQLGRGFLRNLEIETGAQPILITRLVLQFASDSDSGIAKRIQEHHLGELIDAFRTASVTRGGRAANMYREAEDDELALGVNDYAVALATILRAAKGEFTFALLGPWGSGKTTLTRLLKPLLTDPGTFQEVTAAQPDFYARRRYQVVVHNAWKYRTPPEAWIYAYKSLADKASSSFGWPGRTLLAIRTSYYRNGQWPIVGALLTLALIAVPLSAAVQLAVIVASVVGTAALLHMAAITTTVSSKVQELFTKHIRLSSAEEKLGMLALVGDDVRSLLAAWASPLEGDPDDGSPSRFPFPRLALPLCVLGFVALAWTVGLLSRMSAPWTRWLQEFTFHIDDILPQSWIDAYRLLLAVPASSPQLHGEWYILLLWCLLAFMLMVLPWVTKAGMPNRILLVVDDLDRCSPDEMLDVIEGMKLLVDDPAISKRLQVLMLVDESVLNHAISLRYARMIEERVGALGEGDDVILNRDLARREVVAEQNEKLFACHMRIAHLGDSDVAAVVARLSGRELEAMRTEQSRVEKQRLEHQRRVAQKAFDEAASAANAAEQRYISIRDGELEALIDEDAPGKPVPMRTQARYGIDYYPPTAAEVDQHKRANARIRQRNEKRAKKTPEERLEERPDIVRAREETAREKERKERYLNTIGNNRADKPSEKKTPLFESNDVRFSSDEVDQLQRFIPVHLRAIGRRASPRAVRTLLFKIQLCRLLLQLRLPGRPAQTRSIGAILEAFERAVEPASVDEAEREIVSIARQVI